MSISFDGVGQVCATFWDGGVAAGQVAAVTKAGTVGVCGDGKSFCGAAVHCRDGACAVQVRGFLKAKFSGGAPGVGQAALCGDGQGGVRTAGEADEETACLVVDVDESAKCVTILL